ncbi:hypothetical protein BDFB_000355 [Asbolus verrucosus]|uniref:Uncharacterized protein n=1 Tax=Asbolus verrucosus TaxID=1661398 RepID=A0A482W6X8_ASBVE|nr:hypothetical protein BDFB_000355 [Asbolus verrucosus]
MLLAVVLIFEIVLCKLVSVEKLGVVVPRVTFSPAEVACIAGELDLDTLPPKTDGEARLKLETDGEFLGPDELTDVVDGEFRTPGELIVTDGELLIITDWVDGEARMAGELTRLGRQCLTESEPDCESLLLLGEPGEETIT